MAIDDVSRRDMTLLMSYRFSRIGIVVAVAVLTVALITEIWRTGCVRGAISAYHYSPVRTVFTGSLMAVGLCLIVIQGDRDFEEVSLDLAGIFAPIVAVVPTSVNTQCDAAFAGLQATDERYRSMVAGIEESTRLGVYNNAFAYLAVVALVFVLVVAYPKTFAEEPSR